MSDLIPQATILSPLGGSTTDKQASNSFSMSQEGLIMGQDENIDPSSNSNVSWEGVRSLTSAPPGAGPTTLRREDPVGSHRLGKSAVPPPAFQGMNPQGFGIGASLSIAESADTARAKDDDELLPINEAGPEWLTAPAPLERFPPLATTAPPSSAATEGGTSLPPSSSQTAADLSAGAVPPEKVTSEATVSVMAPHQRFVVEVPLLQLEQNAGYRRAVEVWRRKIIHGKQAKITIMTLCEYFARGEKCPAEDRCSALHLLNPGPIDQVLEAFPMQEIHINTVLPSLAAAPFPRLPAGCRVPLWNSSKTHFAHYDSRYLYVTKGSQDAYRLCTTSSSVDKLRMQHCTHYLAELCTRGSSCNFIHVAFVAGDVDCPDPALIERRDKKKPSAKSNSFSFSMQGHPPTVTVIGQPHSNLQPMAYQSMSLSYPPAQAQGVVMGTPPTQGFQYTPAASGATTPSGFSGSMSQSLPVPVAVPQYGSPSQPGTTYYTTNATPTPGGGQAYAMPSVQPQGYVLSPPPFGAPVGTMGYSQGLLPAQGPMANSQGQGQIQGHSQNMAPMYSVQMPMPSVASSQGGSFAPNLYVLSAPGTHQVQQHGVQHMHTMSVPAQSGIGQQQVLYVFPQSTNLQTQPPNSSTYRR